ncbi:unnamed protein product [Prorocentrum cordatum]|uniref:Uncharacterized protein n=1 Tax=Prorocentrum cordatum TaxID=2364126 RepID=A0ABN9VP65_9DINO|nr:unnamed protein product [Polarella glacialis]
MSLPRQHWTPPRRQAADALPESNARGGGGWGPDDGRRWAGDEFVTDHRRTKAGRGLTEEEEEGGGRKEDPCHLLEIASKRKWVMIAELVVARMRPSEGDVVHHRDEGNGVGYQ